MAAAGKRPTIADVARLAGVSPSAVSFAFNNRPGLSDETRARILSAAERVGWQPSRTARALSRGRAGALGLVLTREPELIGADPFFSTFIAGVESVLTARGHGLMLNVAAPAQEAATYRRLAADRRVDGVLITDLRVGDPRPALVTALRMPAVVVGDREFCGGLCSVDLDDRPAFAEAVDHLARLGHRRIAHVAGPAEFRHAQRRREAWAAALTAAGLPQGPVLTGGFSAEGGARATRELLALTPRPTAVVYANDLSAIAGIAVAQEAGFAVPGDLSVVGYDDTPLAAYTHPRLTTARADIHRWGAVAAQTLHTVIERGTAPHVALDPSTLTLRESTGPAPGR
ncbi:LacI family DNA-binding transcriptional regulator [Streptomyces sp. SL13]|jgi:DNA-binding LacI/PurR family transcriptional regulator|uniref:LacI family DNA-binding transcriptional regulator n=1 Tax=Streptantibioticus silvisoli TaxID=2705255 RepID=A0AA90KIM6_9ACTN|nr:LacI family DNA-binding transcriptional regulator [Streptantibioticus silvisoli]MDI5966141.1 LacI family DNA-binding transcriptional regulator [Streptantibioticus silvisoli]MDI5972764.1 LacI family DNA-binding transcriptional regulator [Streptantibioticus silvisoli]